VLGVEQNRKFVYQGFYVQSLKHGNAFFITFIFLSALAFSGYALLQYRRCESDPDL
jgi:hypothetical protein